MERGNHKLVRGVHDAVALGRPNLGNWFDAHAFRLYESSLRETIIKYVGKEKYNQIIYESGELAGSEFCNTYLDTKQSFYAFISQLQHKLREMRMGLLRMEKSDLEKLNFTLTIEEDLDCSGMNVTGEPICHYDEGFLAGIMTHFFGSKIVAKEVECWATGSQTCRFELKAVL